MSTQAPLYDESASTLPPSPPPGFNRFAVPLKWSLIAIPVCILLQFVAYQYILPFSFMGGTMMALFLMQFPVIPLAFYLLCAREQRKAIGGFISFREVFSAIFIVVLLLNIALAIWGLVYATYINPGLTKDLSDGYEAFMIRAGKDQDFIDNKLGAQRAGLAEGRTFKSVCLGLGQNILWHSIVAMICAFIIRRRRPVTATA